MNICQFEKHVILMHTSLFYHVCKSHNRDPGHIPPNFEPKR